MTPDTAATANATFADYFNLTKPRLSRLAAIISAVGYAMGSAPGRMSVVGIAHAFGATFTVSAGAMALNMYLERDLDGLMHRTRERPIPAGKVGPGAALAVGIGLSVAGMAWLWIAGNALAAFAGALAVASYVLIYTPMKRMTSLCTIVGAVPGALPPVIGYAAASGRIDFPCALLFAIMFLWQMPHFLAIAWMYREDYARAGMPMLTTQDVDGRMTARQIVGYSVALLLTSLLPGAGLLLPGAPVLAGWFYMAVALVSGVWFLGLGLRWMGTRDTPGARKVFFASLLHITVLFVTLMVDKRP